MLWVLSNSKKEGGVKINIIAGPILSVWLQGQNLESKSSGILELAENGIINLFCREKMEGLHFIINDDKIALAEAPHPPLASLGVRKVVKMKKGCEDFGIMLDKFNNVIEILHPSRSPREDFILLTPSRIDAIQSSYDFDGLSRQDFLRILDKTPEWE